MPTVAVYDIKNQQVGDIELNENIFGVEVNAGLLHQAVVEMLNSFDVDKKALIITADYVENVDKSSRNIPGVKAINTIGLNVFDILNANKLFITKDAIARIEEVYA